MKRNYSAIVGLSMIVLIVAFACSKKDSTGIAPGFKADKGTGGNPNPNNTVTGTTTNTNLATNNSNLAVGGSGWSNPTCSSTNSLYLQGVNGSTGVTLTFSNSLTFGTYTYAVGSTLSSTMCTMMVTNAPSQPTGLVWYASSGQATVNVGVNSINAMFSSIPCVQQTFNYPIVSVSGTLSCSQ